MTKKFEVAIVLKQEDNRLIGIEETASSTIRSNDFEELKIITALTRDQFKYGLVFYTGSRLLPFGDGKKTTLPFHCQYYGPDSQSQVATHAESVVDVAADYGL